MSYFRSFPSSRQEHLIYYSGIAFTCLNYCCLGKQIMTSKSKCCEILKLIEFYGQTHCECNFGRFKRYRWFQFVYLLFVISFLIQLILCIIMLLLCQCAMLHDHFMRYVLCSRYIRGVKFFSFSKNKPDNVITV